jgi:electron transfer flavoprotein beta subunit
VAEIVACLRWTDLHPAVDPLTGAVANGSGGFAPADLAALEHALRRGGARAVCVAPADAELREVRALVPVVHVEWAAGEETSGSALVRALVPLLRGALVLCGDHGALPALLAHALGVPQALGVVELREGGVVERRLDQGRRERLRIGGPAVVSVEAAGVRIRRAPLAALLEDREIARVVPAPARERITVTATLPFRPPPRVVAPPEGGAGARLRQLTGADQAREPPAVVGPASASEAAGALLGFLERHGYLTSPAATAR